VTEPVPERKIAAELRLRARRPQVVRLSRKVLVGLGAATALAILGAVAYAMTSQRTSKDPPELYSVGAQPPEKVRTLPTDYRAPPRLGPPLPGDLGGPILAAGAPAPTMGMVDGPSDVASDPVAQAQRQRRDQEHEAARASRLFASDAQAPSGVDAGPTPLELAGLGGEPGEAAAMGFLHGPADRRTTSPDRLETPISPYVVQAGAVIPAALITGIQSDLPGQIVGQVTQNVFDTPTGRHLLIPQGARLVGVYESRIAFGQRRVLLAWTRLILPDGKSLVIEKLPAGDLAGYAGLQDRVDRRWSGLFGMAALSTLLGVGAELGSSDDENDIVAALRSGGAQTFNQVGQQAVGQGINVAPTLTIRPGAPLRVMVTRDLVLEPYRS
jgi:type IV secretory pathway VirB10-like protein